MFLLFEIECSKSQPELQQQISKANLNPQFWRLRSQISGIRSQISDVMVQASDLRSENSELGPEVSDIKSQAWGLRSQIPNSKAQATGLYIRTSHALFKKEQWWEQEAPHACRIHWNKSVDYLDLPPVYVVKRKNAMVRLNKTAWAPEQPRSTREQKKNSHHVYFDHCKAPRNKN